MRGRQRSLADKSSSCKRPEARRGRRGAEGLMAVCQEILDSRLGEKAPAVYDDRRRPSAAGGAMLPTPSPSHDPHLKAHDAEGKTEGEAMQQAHDVEGLFERQGTGNDESSGASEMSGARGREWSSTWEEDRSWAASEPRAVARAAQAPPGAPCLYPVSLSCGASGTARMPACAAIYVNH